MSTKPTTHLELVEPLQSFLETITQELTEQKFVPALRDELKRLVTSLENLEQSEDTLQQIARGVERLREVFAPAGTRLLEGVKDLETVMRSNAEQLKERAGDVMRDLLNTHEQLESILRSEAGLLQEQSSASREALGRTVAEVESKISSLTLQVEGLCRKLEQEAASLPAPSARRSEPASVSQTSALPIASLAELPSDLKALITRSEQAIVQELESQRTEISTALQQGRSADHERLSKIDQRIAEALAAVGPAVQEELETAVSRLRDQMQTLILAEVETRSVPRVPAKEMASAHAPATDLTAALTASETRILREIAALQKTPKGELNSERILQELMQGLDAAAQKYAAQTVTDGQAVKDSMATMQRIVSQIREGERQTLDQLALANANLDALVKASRENQHNIEEDFHNTLGRLDQQSESLEKKAEEDRKILNDLAAAMSRTEQAASSATELALAESRTQRERIEAALKDLRERIDRGQTADGERLQETMRRVAEAWTEALEALRDFVQKVVGNRTDAIINRIEGLESHLAESGKSGGAAQRDLHNEIKRITAAFDERLQAVKGTSEDLTKSIESHVSAVSGEVAAMRAKQEQTLAVLKEAIRANYDDNAVKLKEVVEAASDNFIKQTAVIPQSLDRFSHLIQSLHQGDNLALQGIASDTQNVLALSSEKFELILADSGAMKKFFPLLDKKLEKHTTELEMLRKAQVRGEKDIEELKNGLAQNRSALDDQGRELKEEIRRMRNAADDGFESFHDDINQLKSELHAVTEENLPTFRRELNALLASKFEFIETTLRDRQEASRKDIENQLNVQRAGHARNFMILAGLLGLSLLMQLIFHFTKTGVGH